MAEAPAVGVVLPSNNVVLPGEMTARLPGVRFHYEQVFVPAATSDNVALMAQGARSALDRLTATDLAVYACLWTTLVTDDAWEDALGDHSRAIGGPAVHTAARALWTELDRYGNPRIALVTAYPRDVHREMCAYVRGRGYDVAADATLDITSFERLARIETSEIMDLLADLDAQWDLVCVVGTDVPTLGLEPLVEARWGVPLVTSNSAIARSVADALDGQA